ncbi:hypothetical protein [Colwellia sp. E2M01]|uniref:hypothetical protein n=1 Tax=Colwellia sp. E2M01 TaxID=2841561 RepID=UPI001C08EF68|nr:hypothetical protein [Colwellia sp. E2M01]MBU2870580.1 hypothetical protein [Colwellia sp. E2M01]
MTTLLNTEISFRFLKLDKFQAYSLVREIIGSSHSEANNLNKQEYVAHVPLTTENFEVINDYYVRQRIALEACDILVSVSAEQANGAVDIPLIVNKMLKYIDCKLTFSYCVKLV